MRATPARPNLLLIVADDQTHRSIGALNNPAVHTPHLDRLVARGTCFTHAFHQGSWTGAVCVASRAMLHTGRPIFRCGGESCGDHVLLGQHLQAHGYHTRAVGKWHNGGTSQPRSFAEFDPDSHMGMYDSTAFDYENDDVPGDPTQSAYRRPAPDNVWQPYETHRRGHWLDRAGPDEPAGQHSSIRWANRSIRYLNERKRRADDDPQADPFFLYLAFHAPHDPRQAPKEYLDLYPLDAIELPPNYLPEHPFDQGDFGLRDEQLAPWPRTEHAIKVHLREYYAILTHMDAELGRVFDALDANGQTDHTVIAFTADHGLAVGQHGLMGKQNMYDHSTRVPLIWAGPGVPAGERRDALCYQHSVYATAGELLGVAPPASVEFPSLVPLIRDAGAVAHDELFCCYCDFQRSVRDAAYKLIVYPHLGKHQLFHVAQDPWEMHDLSEDADQTGRIRAMFDRLIALQGEVGDELDLSQFPILGRGAAS